MKRKAFKAFIVFFWLASMFALYLRHNPGPTHAAQADQKTRAAMEEKWAGIYRGSSKIGYTMSKIERQDKGYKGTEKAFMKLKAMGVEKEITLTTYAVLDGSFRLESFSFKVESDMDIEVEGEVRGKELRMSISSGGQRSERTVPLEEKPYLGLSLSPLIKSGGIDEGGKIRLPVIDPSTLSQDFLVLEAAGREEITVLGEKIEALRFKGVYHSVDMMVWVDEEAEIVREESAGLLFVRETKEDAMKLDRPSTDLVADISIPFNLVLKAGVKYLKVRLGGVDLGGLELEGGGQTLSGDVLEVRSPDMAEAGRNRPGENIKGLDDYLKADVFVESDAPEVASLAKKITEGTDVALEKAKLIHQWVFENIEKTPTMSIPRATAVLESRRGDCNEHTTLFTALARAAGVPTRIAVGLVYNDGSFYYHAWPEVFEGGWLAIDPTLGQWPADASHIRLLTGGLDRQITLLSLFGRLRLEGLEYR